jgi:hypothetical protein
MYRARIVGESPARSLLVAAAESLGVKTTDDQDPKVHTVVVSYEGKDIFVDLLFASGRMRPVFFLYLPCQLLV